MPLNRFKSGVHFGGMLIALAGVFGKTPLYDGSQTLGHARRKSLRRFPKDRLDQFVGVRPSNGGMPEAIS